MPSTVIEVEVLVARKALELALEIGFDNIILEGILEILFKALKNGGRSLVMGLTNLSTDEGKD